MNEMRWLRLTAIGSNCAFIYYAIISNVQPTLVLHCILLRMNIIRQIQVARSVGRRLLVREEEDMTQRDSAVPIACGACGSREPLLLAEREQKRVARLPQDLVACIRSRWIVQ